ncbi:287_t:CDS:1 [Diversispora eburnea]|uniref:287_t:CDS:1 n=1 Tax=Diversispora eburnea TaxID=1213867 RepID=A0A9N8YYJ3_9GLOM|nr:287_t:CDS:1 [Diversispora eburnea]
MASNSINNNSSQLPNVKITISTSARERLDSLLQQEAEFNFTTSLPTQQNDQQLKFPSQAHISHISVKSRNNENIVETSEEIPNYENTVVDMPPSYPVSFKSEKSNSIIFIPRENPQPWPITKKLFFFGFLFWPLWFAGMGFSVFAKDAKTRLWGRRCIWNSLIVVIVFIYIVIAYIRTDGKLIS